MTIHAQWGHHEIMITLCDTERLPPVNYFTRAIIHKKTHLFRKKNNKVTFSKKYSSDWISQSEKSLLPKKIHRNREPIQDLTDSRGSENGFIFPRLQKHIFFQILYLGKVIFKI